MNVALSKRALIRIISFLAAVLLVAAGIAVQQHAAARDYRLQLENTYARALGELSSYLANISADLEKGQYVGTPTQLSQMSARIWRAERRREIRPLLPAGERPAHGQHL